MYKIESANQLNAFLAGVVKHAGIKVKYRITVDPQLGEDRDWERPEILVEFAGPDSALLLERGAALCTWHYATNKTCAPKAPAKVCGGRSCSIPRTTSPRRSRNSGGDGSFSLPTSASRRTPDNSPPLQRWVGLRPLSPHLPPNSSQQI